MKIVIKLGLFPRRRVKIFAVVFGLSACASFLSDFVRDSKRQSHEPKSIDQRVREGQTTDPRPTLLPEPVTSVGSSFVPGDFMKGTRAGNVSYCHFNYGAPSNLVVSEESVSFTPEGGAGGPYRVLYNVVESAGGSWTNVTFCTHATPELLYHVVEVVRRWDGPVSLAVFAPLGDAGLSLQLVDRLCRCSPRMAALSLHLVFPAEAAPLERTRLGPGTDDCSSPGGTLTTSRRTRGLAYPVNVARNVARTAASTSHVLVADVELLPSHRMASGFTAMWARLRTTRVAGPRHVFVVPVFEVEHGEDVPATKHQLVQLYARGRAVYFHRWVCLHCQRFPGLQRWLHRRPCTLVQPLLVVRREFPYHRWEPVFVGTSQEPLYSETLSWEGQQDKMTQMAEMCLLGYRFVILDGAFLVHVPGVKHRSDAPVARWRLPHERSNARNYASIVDALRRKHGASGRCKL